MHFLLCWYRRGGWKGWLCITCVLNGVLLMYRREWSRYKLVFLVCLVGKFFMVLKCLIWSPWVLNALFGQQTCWCTKCSVSVSKLLVRYRTLSSQSAKLLDLDSVPNMGLISAKIRMCFNFKELLIYVEEGVHIFEMEKGWSSGKVNSFEM